MREIKAIPSNKLAESKNNRKAQAAMEFLMTYGWAILVVLVVISALAYFGVLDPTQLLPERCIFSSVYPCTDSAVSFESTGFTIYNGGKDDLLLWGAYINSSNLRVFCVLVPTGNPPIEFNVGSEQSFFSNSCDFIKSKKAKYEVNVYYSKPTSFTPIIMKGEIFG
ncbi:MAG: hypothetical protein AABX51_03125 [Nanoarchaeota archaeon]